MQVANSPGNSIKCKKQTKKHKPKKNQQKTKKTPQNKKPSKQQKKNPTQPKNPEVQEYSLSKLHDEVWKRESRYTEKGTEEVIGKRRTNRGLSQSDHEGIKIPVNHTKLAT